MLKTILGILIIVLSFGGFAGLLLLFAFALNPIRLFARIYQRGYNERIDHPRAAENSGVYDDGEP